MKLLSSLAGGVLLALPLALLLSGCGGGDDNITNPTSIASPTSTTIPTPTSTTAPTATPSSG